MSLSKYIFKQFQLQKQIMKETVKEMKDFNRLLKSLVFQKLVSTTFQRGFELLLLFFFLTVTSYRTQRVTCIPAKICNTLD